MFKFFLILVLLFLVIRFLLRFLLPVLKMTSMTHQHINDLKKKMEGMQAGDNSTRQADPKQQLDGEYIDYEEVK